MGDVKFGVGLFPIEPIQRMLTLVKLAEEVGFSCAYIGDSQMIWREPYVLLGAAAMTTKRIILATGVTNPITRDLGRASRRLGIAARDGRAIVSCSVSARATPRSRLWERSLPRWPTWSDR